jgi:hypothetical protein
VVDILRLIYGKIQLVMPAWLKVVKLKKKQHLKLNIGCGKVKYEDGLTLILIIMQT